MRLPIKSGDDDVNGFAERSLSTSGGAHVPGGRDVKPTLPGVPA